MSSRARWFLALGVALLLGCEGRGVMEVDENGNPDGFEGPGGTEAAGHGRVARRLTVAQLKASFPVVFGNDAAGRPITWMVGNANGFDLFGRSLGQPDYLDTVDEGRDASALYVKFMDDAARDVCNKVLNADYAKTDPATRTLVRHCSLTDVPSTNMDAVNQNLRYLRKRFHGLNVRAGDDAAIAGVRTVFQDATALNGDSTKEGWRAVCVALTTAPEFNIY
jgi:hypothetical protein